MLEQRLELELLIRAARARWREIEQLVAVDDELDDGWFVQTRLAMLAAADELDQLLLAPTEAAA